MAQAGSLVVEQLFRFVSLVRFVFFTLITNESAALALASRLVICFCDFFPYAPSLSPSVNLCSFS